MTGRHLGLRPQHGDVPEEPGGETYTPLRDDLDAAAGFASAAVPEAINQAVPYSLWGAMTEYGLDKVAHGGFSYFGYRSVSELQERGPVHVKRWAAARDGPVADLAYRGAARVSDPSFQRKAAVGVAAVGAAGGAKELTDAMISQYDMLANAGGAGIGVLHDYGDGSVRRGAARAWDDIVARLDGEPEPRRADGGRERPATLDPAVRERMEALGTVSDPLDG